MEHWTLIAFISIFAFCLSAKAEYLRNVYQDSSSYFDRYLSDSIYHSCQDPLIQHANVSSTSDRAMGARTKARLWSGSAWAPHTSHFQQALVIDLGRIKNVTGIGTQGQAHSQKYVIEYRVQYGSNGKDWVDYKEVDSSPKLFRGNSNGDFVVKNDFDQPIIARWIKVNPTRWAEKIAIRMELYGCDYVSNVLHFNGSAIIKKDLSKHPVTSLRDTIRFRFKTNHENGVVLYSHGSQGDYIVVQLIETRLLLSINLGAEETSLALGSLLDDNIYHEVVISRDRTDVILSVDRVTIRGRINGEFHNMNLDGALYIGGVPHIERGLVTYENFTGCIENMYLNHSNIIASVKDKLAYDTEIGSIKFLGGVIASCPMNHVSVPVTFKSPQSFVRLAGNDRSNFMNISFEFRTYEDHGMLVFHKFSSEGHLRLYLEDGRVKVELVSKDIPKVELDNFDQAYNDGKWHSVELAMSKNQVTLAIDDDPMVTRRLLNFATGPHYMFAGTYESIPGFVGCMRHISIDGNYSLPSSWKEEEYSSRRDIALESCHITDKCTPNPCEHGGVCKQNSKEFYCECDGTGYTGAVCHTSLNFKSCVHYKNAHPDSRFADTIIDVDGSGPLAPFPVRCEFFPDGKNVTYIHHANEESTKVDGFEEKGSYQQYILYDTSMEMMEAMINRSKSCVQKLGYDCKRSRLLNTPVANSDNFSPFGYWVSRQNRPMDYWAGSVPGSRKCECGILGVCFDPSKWCNCDSGHDDWLWDGGEISQKEYLPVRALHFGDTGTPLDKKEGRYSLGPLECEGDTLFDNMVTFRKADAVIELPPAEFGLSGDIYFEFKSTSSKSMVLIHSVGSNGDFIKVSLLQGNHIEFEYESGKGQQGVTVETSYRLDDDSWHSVLVERNRKEAMVVVDGVRKGQVKEPIGPVRPMLLDKSLFVGASNDFTNGFVGCIRALVVNGVMTDLVQEVTKNSWGLYGVSVGCVGKCLNNPCLNNGKCKEGYDHFDCDCRWTPFKGPICADEVGVNMQSNYMVKYDFKGQYKSTLAEKIHLGFTSVDPKGFLLSAYSDISKEYLTLMVSNSGNLRLIFDFGFERQEIVFRDQNFVNGQYHEVWIERFDEGKQLKMTVDNYEPQVHNFESSLKSSSDAQFNNIQYLYIGRNETMAEGFVGCISRVEFDEILPLKLLFQEDPISNIEASPETIAEDFCGIEPVTQRPEDIETRRPPMVGREDIKPYYQNTSSAIMAVVLAIIFIMIVVFALFGGKYANRHKGEYHTREDEGAQDAFDADTAVLQGRTGHQVEKKKEWFI